MMELCAVRVIHNLPPLHTHLQLQPLFPSTRALSPFILKHNRFTSGLRYCVNSPLGSTASGEISTKIAEDAPANEKTEGSDVQPFFTPWVEKKEEDEADKVESDGGVVTSYYTPPVEKREEDSGANLYEADKPKTESVVAVENASLDEKKEDSDSLPDLQKILDDLGIKIDFEENKYSILALGGGGLVALWIASVAVGAIDRVPLVPKVLELVGLGYSIWFAIRYLIFEESRGEFVAKVEQVKEEIFGSDDD